MGVIDPSHAHRVTAITRRPPRRPCAARCGRAAASQCPRDAVPAPGRSSGVTRVQRLLASTVAGSIVWLAGADAARADLILVFAHSGAHPGAVIEAVTADPTGRPEVIPALRGIRVYLVPMTAARSPRHQRPTGPPHDPRWIPLGPLGHRRPGVIRFRFTVPDVRPGDYTFGFWCRRCAPPLVRRSRTPTPAPSGRAPRTPRSSASTQDRRTGADRRWQWSSCSSCPA